MSLSLTQLALCPHCIQSWDLSQAQKSTGKHMRQARFLSSLFVFGKLPLEPWFWGLPHTKCLNIPKIAVGQQDSPPRPSNAWNWSYPHSGSSRPRITKLVCLTQWFTIPGQFEIYVGSFKKLPPPVIIFQSIWGGDQHPCILKAPTCIHSQES